MGPVQNGVGIRGEISVTVFGVQVAMDAKLSFSTFQEDLKKGYNKIKCDSILNAMNKEESLTMTLAFTHALLNPEAYVGMGSSTSLIMVPF